MAGRVRLDVYRGGRLAASFEYGRAPVYHGELGERVRALVEAPGPVRDPRSGALVARPAAGGLTWWVATVLAVPLADAGFEVRVVPPGGRRPRP